MANLFTPQPGQAGTALSQALMQYGQQMETQKRNARDEVRFQQEQEKVQREEKERQRKEQWDTLYKQNGGGWTGWAAATNAQLGVENRQIQVAPSQTQGKMRLVTMERDGEGWKEIAAAEVDDDDGTRGAYVQMYRDNDLAGSLKVLGEQSRLRQESRQKQQQLDQQNRLINAQVQYYQNQGFEVRVVDGGTDQFGQKLPQKLMVIEKKTGQTRTIDPFAQANNKPDPVNVRGEIEAGKPAQPPAAQPAPQPRPQAAPMEASVQEPPEAIRLDQANANVSKLRQALQKASGLAGRKDPEKQKQRTELQAALEAALEEQRQAQQTWNQMNKGATVPAFVGPSGSGSSMPRAEDGYR